VRPKGSCQRKIPMTPSGIDLATFRFVATACPDVQASAYAKLCNCILTRSSVLDFIHRLSFFSLYGNDYLRNLFYLLERMKRNEISILLGL
jgi:hypothetical protein